MLVMNNQEAQQALHFVRQAVAFRVRNKIL
jgi:hypothetical protein